MKLTGLDGDPEFARQMDATLWPSLKERLKEVFLTKTRDEWCSIMEHTDVCFAPVLTMSEAAKHPHNVARSTFVEVEGVTQPAPAPRFSRTSTEIQRPPGAPRAAHRRGARRVARAVGGAARLAARGRRRPLTRSAPGTPSGPAVR
jgi:alpha-methylacyl-CoA racemase